VPPLRGLWFLNTHPAPSAGLISHRAASRGTNATSPPVLDTTRVTLTVTRASVCFQDAATFSHYDKPSICFSGTHNVGCPFFRSCPNWVDTSTHIDGGIQISKDSNSRETLMIRITCDTCGVVRNPGQRGWILGYDLGFDSSETITRSISFFDRWDDSRILERGMIQFCSPECKQAYIAANTLKRRGAGKSVSLRRRGSRAA